MSQRPREEPLTDLPITLTTMTFSSSSSDSDESRPSLAVRRWTTEPHRHRDRELIQKGQVKDWEGLSIARNVARTSLAGSTCTNERTCSTNAPLSRSTAAHRLVSYSRRLLNWTCSHQGLNHLSISAVWRVFAHSSITRTWQGRVSELICDSDGS
jgi:hypothetical protein